jgi:hypothetical protein
MLLLCLVALIALSFSKSPPRPGAEGIRVEGPRAFRRNIERALRLIEEFSPDQFRDVVAAVRFIRLTRSRPGPFVIAYCDRDRRIYIVSEYYAERITQSRVYPFAFYSLPALIVHEATHLQQMLGGRATGSREAELEAIQAERLLRSLLSGSVTLH